MSNLSLPANWRAQIPGILASIGLFLTSYVQQGHRIDFKDPLFWAAVFAAISAYWGKAKNVTGGITPNSQNDPDAVRTTLGPAMPEQKK